MQENKALRYCPFHYLLVSKLALTIAPQDVVKVVKIVSICVVVVGDVPAVVLTNTVPACIAVESRSENKRSENKRRGEGSNRERGN